MKGQLLVFVFATSSVLIGVFTDQIDYCSKQQWQCRDGSCIKLTNKCDGVVDCADRSDETHGNCWNGTCQSNWFRCTYGACVDGTAACNGVQECADNSDELQPECRTETDEVGSKFNCQDGSQIRIRYKCDGIPNCPDGSDETVRTCAAVYCQGNLFQCAYGACVDQGSDCDGKKDCADGSDETEDLCESRMLPGPRPTASTTAKPFQTENCVLPPYPDHGGYLTNFPGAKPGDKYIYITLNFTCQEGYGIQGMTSMYCFDGFWLHDFPKCVPIQTEICVLPPYPDHGGYLANIPGAKPGDKNDLIMLNFTCQEGYSIQGMADIYCLDGLWHQDFPKCVRPCRLNKNSPGVEYWCEIPNSNTSTRPCNLFEPSGTIVYPKCMTSYYSPNVLPIMKCINGEWDNAANCIPNLNNINVNVYIPENVLARNDTNITIVVHDKVTVYVSRGGVKVPGNETDTVVGSKEIVTDNPSNKEANNAKHYDLDIRTPKAE